MTEHDWQASACILCDHVSLPNGMGLDEPSDAGLVRVGVAPNELTDAASRDWIAGTPWHKTVPARLSPV